MTVVLSEAKGKTPRQPQVGSVVQALAILRHLGSLEEGAGVTSVANQLGISPSSCFNILKTLVSEEFLEFEPNNKVYRLGLGAATLARRVLGGDNVLPAIKGAMRELSRRYDATLGLWRIVRSRLLLVNVIESDEATRIHMSVGQRLPLVGGAAGRSVMAVLAPPEAEIFQQFNSVRWQSQPSFEEYLRQVADAKRGGWAVDSGQWRRGVASVASVIVDSDGQPQFVLTMSTFLGYHDHSSIQRMGEEVRELAAYATTRAFGQQMADDNSSVPASKSS